MKQKVMRKIIYSHFGGGGVNLGNSVNRGPMISELSQSYRKIKNYTNIGQTVTIICKILYVYRVSYSQ